MLEALRQLFFGRPTSQIALDLLDILLVAYLAYRVLLALKGTRAMQMVTGLVVLAGVYLAGRWIGLVTLTNVLSTLLSSIIVVVVVVFQNDLRRALSRAGTRPLFRGLTRDDEARVIEEIVAAVTELARLRYGAIITWERDANLDEFVMGAGTPIDAQVTRELLVTTFVPVAENKLHDGAVIVRSLRIAHAGVFFPMPEKLGLDKQFGSRHRAAIGITADTDAIAIVVSEERGTISVARAGTLRALRGAAELEAELQSFLRALSPPASTRGFLSSLVRENWVEKIAAFLVVIGLWYLFVPGSRPDTKAFPIPVKVVNLPPDLELEKVEPREIMAIFSGQRRAFYLFDPTRTDITIDASLAKYGRRTFAVSEEQIRHPPELTVEDIEPEQVRLSLRPIDGAPTPNGTP